MHPKQLSIHDFSYELPAERIASYPLPERDTSRLLIHKNKIISEDIYRNIDAYLPSGSLLIFNNTKVVEARLLFQKPTGAFIEIFCLEPHEQYADIVTAISKKKSVVWMCLIGRASKWKPGQVLEKKIKLAGLEIVLHAKYLQKIRDSFAIELSWSPEDLSFSEILHIAGVVPLPPYIKRDAEEPDKERYQTIYAAIDGSVAAPTAGLHFTDTILKKLSAKNIQSLFVTLHVGAGTFQPVKAEYMEQHTMHAEFIDVDINTIKAIHNYLDKYITVVGTTSLRTIESLYWLGVKTILYPSLYPEDMIIDQWDAYDLPATNVTAKDSLLSLLKWMEKKQMQRLTTPTRLLIVPGYTLKIVHALVTNFHQPQSTLLLLVAAFAGDEWKNIYDYALKNNFRFLSYGDGCLLFRQ